MRACAREDKDEVEGMYVCGREREDKVEGMRSRGRGQGNAVKREEKLLAARAEVTHAYSHTHTPKGIKILI